MIKASNKMEKIKLEEQEILVGSSRLSNTDRKSFDRVKYMLDNMKYNKSYLHKTVSIKDTKKKTEILKQCSLIFVKIYTLRYLLL